MKLLSPITSSLPKKIDKLLFIADEAHHLGSKENSKIMQLKFGKDLVLLPHQKELIVKKQQR